MESIEKIFNKIPLVALAMIYCGWLGYSYYDWLGSPISELGQKKASVVSASQNLENSKKKLVAAEEFYKNLDTLRARIRQLTAQLDNSKGTLSAEVDIANFVRMVTLEAKKLGLVIKGIRPESQSKKDYYIEVPFTVQLKGAYVQVLVFFDRIAKLQQVVRVSDFEVKPSGNVYTKYVELEGSAKLVAYKYLGTSADEIAKKEELKEGVR